MQKFLPLILLLSYQTIYAQQTCKVIPEDLAGSYQGECKNGYANGKGEAKGMHRYIGSFKMGYPEGKGDYYYNDSAWYTGNLLKGLKEGKGELHFMRKGKTDSIISGYWSGDTFRGKDYTTYTASNTNRFDRFEVEPSKESGNSVTIEISTTTGSPNGNPATLGDNSAYTLTVKEVESTNGIEIKNFSEFNTGFKSTVKFQIDKFPAKFRCHLSTGEYFDMELYRYANWLVRIYVNR